MSLEACTFGRSNLFVLDLSESLLVPIFFLHLMTFLLGMSTRLGILSLFLKKSFAHLIDNGPLLLFVPKKKDMRNDVRTIVATNDYIL